MNKRYKFWARVRSFSEKQMFGNYLKPNGGCDSCCPKCKVWESLGNKITTTPLEDGSDLRVCGKCGYEWRAIFTPAGFVQVGDKEVNND